MNRERDFQHRRVGQAGRVPPRAQARAGRANAARHAARQQWARTDEAVGVALEVGEVEHWDSIEHIEYANYVHEFDTGGGNAYGPGSAYDWTGEQR